MGLIQDGDLKSCKSQYKGRNIVDVLNDAERFLKKKGMITLVKKYKNEIVTISFHTDNQGMVALKSKKCWGLSYRYLKDLKHYEIYKTVSHVVENDIYSLIVEKGYTINM